LHHVAAELADRQEGMVAVWQLLAAGYSRSAVSRRVRWQEFVRIHTGVFFVGHGPIRFEGRCMAAALACGPDAVISHHAAAALYDLRPAPQAAIDVTAPKNHCREHIRCHVSKLAQHERTRIGSIPVTTVERAYLDYAEQATPRQLIAALEAGERRNILDFRRLQFVIDSAVGRRGLKPLRAAIADMSDDLQWTQSDLEDRFLELVIAAGLPRPQANRLEDGRTVDFIWRAQRLIVEVDSFGFHKSRWRFEDDRIRDTKLQKLGWRVIRVTDRRLANEPDAVIADIRELLGNQ
jgi:very-short-patch-repair endonuclease